ncbi:MAG: NUDIX domain-containing protein [Bacteroidales bacterium]|nr:NUDIX domain-containing protein [Bacteroidales bacterium]
MQNYTIFNKQNKVSIVKTPIKDENFLGYQTIYCNSDVLSSYDFSTLFDDKQTENYLIVVEQEDIKTVFERVTSSLYFVKAAGGIVRNENGDYLFMFRNGFWDLPKGHHEKGETIEQTAKREVLEECGMKQLEVREYLASSFHTYYMNSRKEIKQTYWYDMYCHSSEMLTPQEEEGIQQLEWITQKDLPGILSHSYPNIRCLFESIASCNKYEK